MDNWPGWVQAALAVISAAIAAIVGTITATLRFSSRLERQDERIGELRNQLQAELGALELRIERRIQESRHQVMQTVQGVAIAPLEKLEAEMRHRIGAAEQDIAVLKDREKR